MGDIRNKISAQDSHIWTLRIGLVVLSVLLGVSLTVIAYLNTQVDVHVPPDISKGGVLIPGQLQKPNSYTFALTVWKSINAWKESGNKEYGANIEQYSCQLTPKFKSYLVKHLKKKNKQGELDRSRDLYETVAYKEEFVTPLGGNTYAVALLLQLKERVENLPIKDVPMQYSLRVVTDSRACNKFGMALDGFANNPFRTESKEDA